MMNEIKEDNNNNNNLLSVIAHDPDQDKQITNAFVLARTDSEKSHFRAIQQALNKINIRVRAVHQNHILYICHDDHWRREVNNYLQQITVFSLIGEMNSSDNPSETILKTMCDQIVSTLHHLFHRKAITNEQYGQMMYFNQLSTFRVNKLYFIPHVYKMEIIMQPMLTSYVHEPIKAIARFLNILLEPVYEQATPSMVFMTGMNAIQAFEKYAEQGHLQSTTLLATVQIDDLYTVFSHDFMIEALEDFLRMHAQNKQIQGTSTSTIIQLIQLILQNQYFLYENKLYQQIAGGPLSAPLTKTLANIYLFYWQQDFVSTLINRNEWVGRCFDQLFFTWNESTDELQTVLDQMLLGHLKNAHIRITTSVGHKIHYLDAELGHDEGILQTKVYHEPNIEPYALPYVYETTQRQDHLFLLRAALIRAVLCCSNVDEFENERFYIELSFLINEASLNFIDETIQKFFYEFNACSVGVYLDEETYRILRQQVQQYHQQHTKHHIRQRKKRQQRRQWELLPRT